jgi:hypothetical protein
MKDPLRETKDAERAAELFDLLSARDRTISEVRALTGWNSYQYGKAVQRLRDILAADGDDINVVAEPQGHREGWLYGLRAGSAIVDASESQWVPNRMKDAERRLKTIKHVMQAAVSATDGRSVVGKKARIWALHLTRAEEEITLIDE